MPLDKQITIGMSGHIDHGKTSIVKALTGKNTDSLKQERERGMTIDLGFAFLNDRITIIDVPGHEKFVKNMMSGSSGIDMAILVIAADDGVMPQTIEHFEILKLLNIRYGFIILNKIDLADDDWMKLVENDIKDITKESFLDNCQIIRVSSIKNIGIREVQEKIEELYQIIPNRKISGIFRMHIDRVFSKVGFGCVVTGTIGSGSVKIGDILELLPSGQKVKVRSIQSHGINVEVAYSGERAAINLNNTESNKLKRGYHLSKINTYSEIKSFICNISLNSLKKTKIKNNQRIRVHLGTREVMARVSIIKNDNNKNLKFPALIRLEKPIIAGIGDYFIVRSYSPVYTIGGGTIIDIPEEENWKKIKSKTLHLYNSSNEERVYKIINNISNMNPLELVNVEKRLNISINEMKDIIKEDSRYNIFNYNSYSWIITNEKMSDLKKQITDYLSLFHNENPMDYGCNKNILLQKTNINENLLSFLLEKLKTENKVKINSEQWSLASFSININSDLDEKKKEIIKYLDSSGFIDLKEKNIIEIFNMNIKEFYSLLNLLSLEGDIIKINQDIVVSNSKLIDIKLNITNFLSENDSLSVPDFKEMIKITRKYAIPVLEYLDKIKFTFRDKNSRKLVSN